MIGDTASASGIDSGKPSLNADSLDPIYNAPYIIVEEERLEPVPHRYVHGGFQGTNARFSFYFPPEEKYRERFFHNTYPLAVTSDIGPFPIQFDVAIGDLGFTIDSGAYYVQTNLGGADRMTNPDPTIGAFRVNAAAAKFSRQVAARLYGEHHAFGYLFGGSGGSYQVMGAAENTEGVWDGFLPYVMGTPYAAPSVFTVRLHPLRVLKRRGKWAGVMDAINPGGSGDPYAHLDDEERAALLEATHFGFPPRAWYDHATLNSGYLAFGAVGLKKVDAAYLEDFWTKSGYLGADPTSSIHEARVQFETTIERMIDGPAMLVEFSEAPDLDFADAELIVLNGAAAGKSFPLAALSSNPIGFAVGADQADLRLLAAGDRVKIDNSWILALQTYQRHQVPIDRGAYGWEQFRDEAGEPIYPQRPVLMGTMGSAGAAGSLLCGRIRGKMLILEALMDIDAIPWQADWYRTRVKDHLGGAFDDNFALWFIDHAQHDNPLTPQAHAHAVSFAGALQQGLRDLSAWVENGIKPLETNYVVRDAQVQVPELASARGGIQPVVSLLANGSAAARIAVGESVTLSASIEVPPHAGKLVTLEWDFEGKGTDHVMADIGTPAPSKQVSASHAFTASGTYFPVVRVTSHRDGDVGTPYARVQNIARVRVVVE